jgi:lipopolysaccharide biosynthesis glycosyltransferase
MSIEDLSALPFPDQDLLNDHFQGKWQPLLHTYNALKTLSSCHAEMWRISEVKNLHYILVKPWEMDMKSVQSAQDPYFELARLWWDVWSDIQGS